MRLSEVPWVGLDCETSGVDPETCELLEVAAVDFSLGSIDFSSLHSLCKPTQPIPCEVSAVHGMVNEDFVDAPSRASVNTMLASWVFPETIVVAHNAAFDKTVLLDPLGRYSWCCSERLAHHLLPDAPNFKLATLRYYLRDGKRLEDFGVAHRALADTFAVVSLFRKLIEIYAQLPGVDIEAEDASERLIEFVNRPYAIKALPFGKHRGQPIATIPESYLKWALFSMADLRPDTRAGIELELQRRDQHAEAVA